MTGRETLQLLMDMEANAEDNVSLGPGVSARNVVSILTWMVTHYFEMDDPAEIESAVFGIMSMGSKAAGEIYGRDMGAARALLAEGVRRLYGVAEALVELPVDEPAPVPTGGLN